MTDRLARRPAGYRSNAGFVADEGKYRYPEDRDVSTALAVDSDALSVALADVMQRKQRVLVVGSPPGTFEDKLRRHPLVLLWPSSERSASDGTRVVPAEVGAILLTSQLSHALSDNVRTQAKERRLLCTGMPMSPGAVKRALLQAFEMMRSDDAAESEAQEMATPKHPALVAMTPRPVEQATHEAGGAAHTDIVRLIDDTIAGLQLIREAAVKMVDEAKYVAEQRKALELLRGLLK